MTHVVAPRAGRPPSTSAGELEQVAFDLFLRHGFEETTLEDVAAAAGISKRTFFRYHRSKNDLVWGADFDVHLARFRDELAAGADLPMMQALRRAVVEFNRVEGDAVVQHRRRMSLILTVPALQAHSTLRYAAWRGCVEEFVAARSGREVGGLEPRLVGHLALATSVAAYEQWLAEPDAELGPLIDRAFALLAEGFGGSREDHRQADDFPHPLGEIV